VDLNNFLIETNQSTSEIRLLNDDIAICERHQTYEQSHQVDAFGPFWNLIMADLKEGEVSIRKGASFFELAGPTAIYIPSFKIVEWAVRPGFLKWVSISSAQNSLENISSIRVLKLPIICYPKNTCELKTCLKKIKSEGIDIPDQSHCSALSERLKNHLDLSFRERQKIFEQSGLKKYSPVVLSRSFRKAYGISPGTYRHRLRLFEAIRLMKHLSVLDATLAVGYSDPGQFISQFQKFLGTSPKQYRKGRILFARNYPTPVLSP
jgi:AraC-like DNA-binding protein